MRTCRNLVAALAVSCSGAAAYASCEVTTNTHLGGSGHLAKNLNVKFEMDETIIVDEGGKSHELSYVAITDLNGQLDYITIIATVKDGQILETAIRQNEHPGGFAESAEALYNDGSLRKLVFAIHDAGIATGQQMATALGSEFVIGNRMFATPYFRAYSVTVAGQQGVLFSYYDGTEWRTRVLPMQLYWDAYDLRFKGLQSHLDLTTIGMGFVGVGIGGVSGNLATETLAAAAASSAGATIALGGLQVCRKWSDFTGGLENLENTAFGNGPFSAYSSPGGDVGEFTDYLRSNEQYSRSDFANYLNRSGFTISGRMVLQGGFNYFGGVTDSTCRFCTTDNVDR